MPKKPRPDGSIPLRKLLMCCPANYCMEDAKGSANHGLLGGGALSQMINPSEHMCLGAFDESNAFTSVLVPSWLSFWQCCPPVLAMHVWDSLPFELRGRIKTSTYVYPRYLRLALGHSHPVHILMSINITAAGRALHASRRLLGTCSM